MGLQILQIMDGLIGNISNTTIPQTWEECEDYIQNLPVSTWSKWGADMSYNMTIQTFENYPSRYI